MWLNTIIHYPLFNSIHFNIMIEGKEESEEAGTTSIRKLQYFIEKTDNIKPRLPSVIPITQLAREYLNDDDFKVLINEQSVFTNSEEEQKMEEVYEQWATTHQSNYDLDDFLLYWIQQSPHLAVHYSLFDDTEGKEEASFQPSSMLEKARKSHPFIKKANKKMDRIATNPSVDKSQISMIKSLKKLNREQSEPKQLLQKFFIFYSKKQVNSNIETFNRYEQECNSLNLTKWMRYCRDVGLMRFKKTLTNNRLKEIFVKYEDKDKMLILQQFQAAVLDLLKFLFSNDESKVKEVGYQVIGIKNQENFERKFQQMGELAPNYCINLKLGKKRCNGIVSKTSLKSKLDTGLKESKIAIQYTTIGSQQPQKHISSFSLPKVKQPFKASTNPVERNSMEASQVSSKFHSFLKDTMESHDTTISRILNKRTIKQRQEILSSMINEPEDDPYLKRYNDKENLGRYRCVANRIDERIEKIQGKY